MESRAIDYLSTCLKDASFRLDKPRTTRLDSIMVQSEPNPSSRIFQLAEQASLRKREATLQERSVPKEEIGALAVPNPSSRIFQLAEQVSLRKREANLQERFVPNEEIGTMAVPNPSSRIFQLAEEASFRKGGGKSSGEVDAETRDRQNGRGGGFLAQQGRKYSGRVTAETGDWRNAYEFGARGHVLGSAWKARIH
ncbi:hypothetical protein MVEN_00732800 [Mycena venus]|uniref:Uncharacterized protein n=1 Tax=Mycena venus TaxID=2733690 RepID=A0A8H6YKP4_9AGAR|nr:hypothetical protein MVEN_00732800 [Mycena venus]